ncbi:MAG: UDP-N-acetylglucosamine--N-acetylmuramyl-(pentapeptide) pyrophosphoryl-undecaprenol N-acetylglucosamine transferase, partial [Actinobacteria bacterium]|nr:UDP-N-acetylglucosamine--N-acetylmuramyl-(pentapeptide) pyrophosphoryl-undecaprenol N-acetylglucosamine transferase [Actinomycetota bacterium]
MTLVIAGGGTAGHVLPALAVARALVARGHASGDIQFVGSSRGIEARIVAEAGFPITLLPGRGLARRLTPANFGAVLGLSLAAVRALRLVARWRPSVILSVGGYASVPCTVAAVLLRVPLVLHDQNAVPGLANRLAGRFARASAVSFEATPLPRAVVTGNPVRTEVLAADRSPAGRRAARQALGLASTGLVLAVFGGSLGARRINEAVADLVRTWSPGTELTVYHVVGSRDWGSRDWGSRDWTSRDRAGVAWDGLDYRAVEYEERMPLLLAAADVALCRAGGTSVAELAAVGLASVLVPLPSAPGDHQTANAGALVQAGAAVMVPDHELTAERLAAELEPLLG